MLAHSDLLFYPNLWLAPLLGSICRSGSLMLAVQSKPLARSRLVLNHESWLAPTCCSIPRCGSLDEHAPSSSLARSCLLFNPKFWLARSRHMLNQFTWLAWTFCSIPCPFKSVFWLAPAICSITLHGSLQCLTQSAPLARSYALLNPLGLLQSYDHVLILLSHKALEDLCDSDFDMLPQTNDREISLLPIF